MSAEDTQIGGEHYASKKVQLRLNTALMNHISIIEERKNMNEQVRATDFLRDLGYPASITHGGASKVLSALYALGIKPSDQRVAARGVSFYVSKADAERAKKSREAKTKKSDNNQPTGQNRRDVRTIARALLDLYARLGEEPHEMSTIRRIAEREI